MPSNASDSDQPRIDSLQHFDGIESNPSISYVPDIPSRTPSPAVDVNEVLRAHGHQYDWSPSYRVRFPESTGGPGPGYTSNAFFAQKLRSSIETKPDLLASVFMRRDIYFPARRNRTFSSKQNQ
jgi:hypothetical protein